MSANGPILYCSTIPIYITIHEYRHVFSDPTNDPELARKITYNASNDPFFQRGITFTRVFTTDVSQSFKRTFTHNFGDIQMDVDDDEVRDILVLVILRY